MEIGTVFGWIAIGVAASLAGMIWPFQRGALGILVNLFAGVLGAVLGGLSSFLVLPTHPETSGRHFFAALGALACLAIVHGAWVRVAESLRTRRSPAPPLR